jgi:tRNA G10  N-methylase Trm11
MAKYNDLEKSKWKQYSDVHTDSLWIINKRENSGAHKFIYHGNFVPQIAYQLLSRYTKKGEWILDPFLGSGTTIIQAQRMKRNSIGVELLNDIKIQTEKRIKLESVDEVNSIVLHANSMSVDFNQVLKENKIKNVQFVIFHPPYWDIIKFSSNPEDLSNANSLNDFKVAFGKIIDNSTKILEAGRYCALVMGDKYSNSQITPLGFICMNLFLERGFILKATIVKNIGETKGKSHLQAIWRYRALSADYYIFKHEYIFVFKKPIKAVK